LRERVSELDGLRGVAILLVLVFHFTPTRGPLQVLEPFLQTGWAGVDLFFVLSGYLITGILLDTAGQPGCYRNFIVRRSLRIFPLYYASLVADVYLSYYPAAANWKDFFTTREGWWYFGYVSNIRVFLDNQWPSLSILTPLWSLSVEEQFYLLFPLVVLFVQRKTLARVLLAAIAVAFAIRLGLVLAMPANTAGTYTLTPCRMDCLALGGLIAIAKRDYPEMLKPRWIASVGAVCTVIFLLISRSYTSYPWSAPMRTIGFTALDTAFAALLAILVSYPPRWLKSALRFRPLVWIGTVSYGMYLLHLPAALLARRIAGARLRPGGTSDFFLSIGAAICAASISWIVFESPILKLKDRWAPRSPQLATVNPASGYSRIKSA
jgi:peptidoglycan/LPS O-acetylase OafA/YrhL